MGIALGIGPNRHLRNGEDPAGLIYRHDPLNVKRFREQDVQSPASRGMGVSAAPQHTESAPPHCAVGYRGGLLGVPAISFGGKFRSKIKFLRLPASACWCDRIDLRCRKSAALPEISTPRIRDMTR